MPMRLPFSSLLVPARQIGARLTPAKITQYGCAIVFLPAVPRASDWAALPFGDLLRELYQRKGRKPGDSVQLRVGARAQTLILAVCLADTASTFERLQSAGKLARIALEGEPQSLILCASGCAQHGLRPARRSGSPPRNHCGTRSGSIPLRHLQEQSETTPPAGADRHRYLGKAGRSRSHLGHRRRQQPGALADGTAPEYSGRRRVSTFATGSCAPLGSEIQVLR
jgi:hypothetical protein